MWGEVSEGGAEKVSALREEKEKEEKEMKEHVKIFPGYDPMKKGFWMAEHYRRMTVHARRNGSHFVRYKGQELEVQEYTGGYLYIVYPVAA